EFAGNLVEVCPTGVFTDKTLKKHYTRKWDLQMSPAICAHCGLGCNVTVGERYGTVRRIVNRFNHAVNGYFLCDRGRYGYEFVNGERRIRQLRLRNESVTADVAMATLRMLSDASVIGIGSPRAALESNFALRQPVTPERFYAGFPASEARVLALILDIIRRGPRPGRRPAQHRAADGAGGAPIGPAAADGDSRPPAHPALAGSIGAGGR